MSNEQRVCVVTGGASGIGAACVRRFVREGYRVLIGDIQDDKGKILAAELGADVHYWHLNVGEERHFHGALEHVRDHWGRLDCMVNNAAIVGALGPISQIDVEAWDFSTDIILRSVFLGCKHAARMMQAQRSGAIVNIASSAGLLAGYAPHIYSACKAAVIQLTKSVALELAEDDVRVNAVCPGNTETPIHTGVSDDRWLTRMDKIRGNLMDDQALHRIAKPEEIAAAVYWLASEQSSFVTGHALAVDGGTTAGRLWRKQPQMLREYHPGKAFVKNP